MIQLGGGLGIGSIALMLLGTQWYILFNVIAGAMAIPSDLKEVATLYKFTRWQRWKTRDSARHLSLSRHRPDYRFGRSVERQHHRRVFSSRRTTRFRPIGLGAQISAATDHGQFSILLLATILMATMVVTMNRLVWRPLYRLAETKFRLDT